MTDISVILGASDLSAPARRAMTRAALVSSDTAARLELHHVVDLDLVARLRQWASAQADDMPGHIMAAAQLRLQELATTLAQQHGISAHASVASGPLLAQLVGKAVAIGAALLVCGAKGESVVRHAVLGSTATRLLNKARGPILIVKQAAHEPYRRLPVPVDFSSASVQAIRHARAVAPGAQLVLLHAYEVPLEGSLRHASVASDTIEHYRRVAAREAGDKLFRLIAEAGLLPHEVESVVLHGDPRLLIVEQELEQECDLTVMGKRGKGTLEELLLGSVTEHVLAQSQGDVLVSPEPSATL